MKTPQQVQGPSFYPSFTHPQIVIEQRQHVRHWDTTRTKTYTDSKTLKIWETEAGKNVGVRIWDMVV